MSNHQEREFDPRTKYICKDCKTEMEKIVLADRPESIQFRCPKCHSEQKKEIAQSCNKCGKAGHVTCGILQKGSEWKVELIQLISREWKNGMWHSESTIVASLKSFISNLLSSTEQRVMERVKKLIAEKRKNLVTDNNGTPVCNPRCHDSGKDDALSDLLSTLETKEK